MQINEMDLNLSSQMEITFKEIYLNYYIQRYKMAYPEALKRANMYVNKIKNNKGPFKFYMVINNFNVVACFIGGIIRTVNDVNSDTFQVSEVILLAEEVDPIDVYRLIVENLYNQIDKMNGLYYSNPLHIKYLVIGNGMIDQRLKTAINVRDDEDVITFNVDAEVTNYFMNENFIVGKTNNGISYEKVYVKELYKENKQRKIFS